MGNDESLNITLNESTSNKLYNSITKIQINGNNGTGFFMKIEINGKEMNYLLTHNQIVSQAQITSKKDIDLICGKDDEEKKTIKLDEDIRNIIIVECITLIEIIPKDGISENKYMIADLNYKKGYEVYKKAKVFTIGYNNNYKERYVSLGKITSIKDFEFNHTSNANLGSPIFSYEDQFVIGIHKQKTNGIFIGKILDKLGKENINIKNNKQNVNRKYYNFEKNKDKYILFINKLLEHFQSQNENKYNENLNDLNKYLSDKNITELKDILPFFKKINNYDEILKNCLGDQGFIRAINKLIRKGNNELYKKSYFFITSFIYSLENSEYKMKSETQLYRGDALEYNELLEYKNNIDKLIFYKGFCTATPFRAVASVYSRNNAKIGDYRVITTINYKIDQTLRPYCFDISEFDVFKETKTGLFTLFTCFKVKDVKIDENKKSAEILLDSVGIKMNDSNNEIKNIIYKVKESVLEIVNNKNN